MTLQCKSGTYLAYLTSSILRSNLNDPVPKGANYPNMIFSVIPYIYYTSEKTLAVNNYSTVYSKLAFLNGPSTILLIPCLVTGFTSPYLVIKSDSVIKCL